MEDKQVDSDTGYLGEKVPQHWLAFDSLADPPQVISQGTLVGADLTAPDEVYFTNWGGSLADNIWHFDLTPGRDFLRAGEYELDSAIAIFFGRKSPWHRASLVVLYPITA